MTDLLANLRRLGENDNRSCIDASGGKLNFPCDVNAPQAVSVAIGAGGLALLFVVYLMSSVSPSFFFTHLVNHKQCGLASLLLI